MIRAVLLSTAALLTAAAPAMAQDEAAARRILERTPLIDGHNDLPWALRQGFGNDPHAVDLTANLDASTAPRPRCHGSKSPRATTGREGTRTSGEGQMSSSCSSEWAEHSAFHSLRKTKKAL